jgi:hypothetical protein
MIEERALTRKIKETQRNGLDTHYRRRRDCLLRTVIEGRMEGKRTRGRPRQMMLDWMIRDRCKRQKEKA